MVINQSSHNTPSSVLFIRSCSEMCRTRETEFAFCGNSEHKKRSMVSDWIHILKFEGDIGVVQRVTLKYKHF